MYSILYPDILIKDDFKYEKPIAADKCQLIKYDAKTSKEIGFLLHILSNCLE